MDSLSPPLPKPAAHKRRQVADSLRQMVVALQAGDRLPSVTELEKHFGVAKSTVEAAVGELQSEGLIVRRQGSGTFVSGLRSPMPGIETQATRRTGRILITSIGLGDSINIFSALASAVAAEMGQAGYDPVLLFESSAQQRLNLAQERYAAGNADGYVHIGSLGDNLIFPPVPGVALGEVPEEAAIHQVTVDNYGGGRRAGAYLWDLGHRRVACIAAEGLLPGPIRFQGLAAAMRERGGDAVSVVESYIAWRLSGHHDLLGLETALRTLRDSPDPPTAIFCGNDQVAFPALQTLLSWGIRVPQDISVISFDDTPGLASHTRPGLSCLRMPSLSLASIAVQTLRQAIEEPGMPFRRLHLPAELILRESSGPPPGH